MKKQYVYVLKEDCLKHSLKGFTLSKNPIATKYTSSKLLLMKLDELEIPYAMEGKFCMAGISVAYHLPIGVLLNEGETLKRLNKELL